MIWNTSILTTLHLIRATAIFVVDCCQFGPSWIFGLKTEIMAYTNLFGGTPEESCIFTDFIWKYQWYEALPNFLQYTSAVAHPFLLLIAANLAQTGFLGWKWSLWPVLTWLAVQWSKGIFSLTFTYSINYMKHFLTFCITPQPCHIHFWYDYRKFGPSWVFGLKIELMDCV